MNRWFTTNNENNRPAGQRTFNGLRLFSKEKTHDPHPMCERLPGAIEVDI